MIFFLDTPKKLWPLHWLLWGVAVGGVAMLMTARGHYSIDVIVAYFVTTRLWAIHYSVIHNRVLQQESSTNYLSRWVNCNLMSSFDFKLNLFQVMVVEAGGVV